MSSQMKRLLGSYRPLEKCKGSFLTDWSEANQTRQHLGSQNMVTDDDKVKDGKAGCLQILGRQNSTKNLLTSKIVECIVFPEPNYFLPHHHCFFQPICFTTMTKILTPLKSQKLHLQNCPQRAVFRILGINT